MCCVLYSVISLTLILIGFSNYVEWFYQRHTPVSSRDQAGFWTEVSWVLGHHSVHCTNRVWRPDILLQNKQNMFALKGWSKFATKFQCHATTPLYKNNSLLVLKWKVQFSTKPRIRRLPPNFISAILDQGWHDLHETARRGYLESGDSASNQ